MPTAIAASTTPDPSAMCSPARTAITAAIAPSVETIGATIPTFPTRRAEYASRRPTTFPAPERTRKATESSSSPSGRPSSAAHGTTMQNPVKSTHASTDGAPIMRVARDAVSVVTANATAAPSPPRIATIAQL